MTVKMSDRRQRRRQDHIIMCTTAYLLLVCMGKPIGREKTRVRTHARTYAAQLVCTRACTVVRAYLWISIQWWCLLEIPRRFPPSTPAPCFSSVPENRDALLLDVPRTSDLSPSSRSDPGLIEPPSSLPLYVTVLAVRSIDLVFALHFAETRSPTVSHGERLHLNLLGRLSESRFEDSGGVDSRQIFEDLLIFL